MKKAAHSSGDYLASASDLMASLVFVFVIVAVLFALRSKDAQDAATTAQRRADAEQTQLKQANQAVVGAAAARKDLLDKVKAALKQHSIKVEVTADGIRFESEVLFASNESRLTKAGQDALDKLGKELKRLLPCFVPSKTNSSAPCEANRIYPGGIDALLVEGHTDARPIPEVGHDGGDGNWRLSTERALAAFQVLEPQLRDFRNLNGQRLLGISGYGSSRPTERDASADGSAADLEPHASADGSAADLARDRRIEIRILMAAPSVQGGDGGAE
ncbi:MAG: OmpA family protein [Myxococcales bacterium]|nr:OmpA family protein [Myxococcales bacterium]